jgi:tetratricopeptide (TPR) repeat protein
MAQARLLWQHPRLAALGSAEIFAIASAGRLMPALLGWLAKRAAGEQRAWRARGIRIALRLAWPASGAEIDLPAGLQQDLAIEGLSLEPLTIETPGVEPNVEELLSLAELVRMMRGRSTARDWTRRAEHEFERVLALAESFARGVLGSEAAPTLTALVAERDAITLALDWTFAEQQTIRALRLTSALRHYWLGTEKGPVGRTYLLRALALPRVVDDASPRALAESALAIVHLNEGELIEARAAIGRGLELAGSSSAAERFRLLNNAGLIDTHLDDRAGARRWYEGALLLARAAPESPGSLANVLSNLGTLAQREGHLQEARDCYTEALELRASLPNRPAWALTRVYLAGLDFEEGAYDLSLRGYREALAVYAEIGTTGEVAVALEGVVLLAAHYGQSIAALQVAGAVAAIRSRARFLPALANTRNFGEALAQAGADVTPAQRSAALLVGRALSRDSAVSYALSLPLEPAD